MKGKSARAKGALFERWVAGELSRAANGATVLRNLSQSRDGGYDIRHGALTVECKRRHRVAAMEWYRQAVKAAGAGDTVPVVVFREDHEPTAMVLLSMPDFLRAAAAAGWL